MGSLCRILFLRNRKQLLRFVYVYVAYWTFLIFGRGKNASDGIIWRTPCSTSADPLGVADPRLKTSVLWTDETKINLYQNDGKRRVWRKEGTAHDLKHTTSSVKHGGGSVTAWACMAANGTGSLVFIDDVTADKSSRMNSEVFRAILSAQIQPNASELIGQRFTVQMDNDPKHTAKATKEFFKAKKWNVLQWPSQSPDLNPIEHAFHLLKTKLKGKCPKNKQELKTVAVEAWQSIRDETQRLVMSMGSRLQRICNRVLKVTMIM